MSTEVQTLDLVPENLSAILSLIGREQGRLVKEEGLDKSPARYKAVEILCEKVIRPQVKASDLLSWIGKTASQVGVQKPTPQPSNGNGHVKGLLHLQPAKYTSADDDPDFARTPTRSGQSTYLRDQLQHLRTGNVATMGPYENQIEARRAQTIAASVIKNTLKWPRLEGDKPAYKSVTREKVDGWYLKVMRLA